jgi:hypothetical protein
MDYYNSFVILPFLCEIYKQLNDLKKYNQSYEKLLRYSEFLERLISPEGYFPIFGRSAVYRTAIFHALVYSCFNKKISSNISYGQIRNALTTVIKNMFKINDEEYLQLGFNGYQPEIADVYSNSGSVYFALIVFLPLGLNKNHPFWTEKDEDWTQKKLWSGKIVKKDNNYIL